MQLDNYLNTSPALYNATRLTDESTSNPTQLSPGKAMELLLAYCLRQTNWTIVGDYDEVHVAGDGRDYVEWRGSLIAHRWY